FIMERKTEVHASNRQLAKKKKGKFRRRRAITAVTQANGLEDPLAPFPYFRKYNNSGINASLFVKRVTDLDDIVLQWAFNLIKCNLKEKYEQSSWGWNDEEKMTELSDKNAWYLIAKEEKGDMLGFSHFRFDLDQGIEVLYCYELQLVPTTRGKGLGKYMMQILEAIALVNNMRKVVLTVLKNNPCSVFFKLMGYKIDESSPEDDEKECFSYEILSKAKKHLTRVDKIPGRAVEESWKSTSTKPVVKSLT
ncbi:hypothetical protein NQ315_011346, partial [Exocentrus adspersus]